MKRWKCAYPKLISLKPWSQQDPILFLNIQASSEIVWFEMLRANHQTLRRLPLRTFCIHEIDPSLSPFLRFRTIIAIKRYGMKHNTFLYVSGVVTSPYNTPSWHFFRTTFAALPSKTSKCVKYRIIVFSILRHIRRSAHALLTLRLGFSGGKNVRISLCL